MEYRYCCLSSCSILLRDLGIPMNFVYAWSDSAVILGWMKTYIFHGVQDTINRIPFSNWGYVNTIHNPADVVSRGVSPKELVKNKLWWEGPTWLLSYLPGGPDALVLTGKLHYQNSSLLSPLVLVRQKNIGTTSLPTESCAVLQHGFKDFSTELE